MRRIGAELGSLGLRIEKEFTAYRTKVEEERACFDAVFPFNLRGPLSWGIRFTGRVGSEIKGVVEYSIERSKNGHLPEEILLKSCREIGIWRRKRLSWNSII